MFQEWLAMEDFFYYQLFYISVVAIVIAVLITAVLGYGIKHNRLAQTVLAIAVIFLLSAGPYCYLQFQQYGGLRAHAQFANPAVRDYQQHMLSQVPFSEVEKGLYRSKKMTKAFEGVGLYQKQEMTQPIQYLGKDNASSYFKIEDEILAVSNYYVTYQPIEVSRMVGTQYILQDHQFEKLGFVPSSHIFFSHFEVPNSQKQLLADKTTLKDTKIMRERVGKWITR